MSETKLEFLTKMMGDPGMRQRNQNAQDRRRVCETLWAEKQEAIQTTAAEPEATPEPEAEVVAETKSPDPGADAPDDAKDPRPPQDEKGEEDLTDSNANE